MEHKQINSEDASYPLLSNALHVIKEFCRTVTHQLQTEVFPCSRNSACLCVVGDLRSVSHPQWAATSGLRNLGTGLTCSCQRQMHHQHSGVSSPFNPVIPPQTELTLMFCKAQWTAKRGTLWVWHRSSATWTLQQKQKAETTPLPPELQQCLKRAKAELLYLWSKMDSVRKGLEGILDFTLKKQSTNWLFIKVKWKIGYLKAAENFCSLLSCVYI